jgi:hypothetical protein
MTAAETPPSVVLSVGLGVDSTAILLRWLREPATRDFDLGDLLAVTAHTGNEWPDTIELANAYLLPLMAAHRIRYAQVARAGASQRDGIAVLADTRAPDRLITTGGHTLAENLLCAGTIPQSSGDRRHSVNFKGVPLDKFIAAATAGRPYRHVIGFEATETARAERDARHGTPERTPAYPLIEWGWDRQACANYIRHALGVDWPKSACPYCPFALNPTSRPATLARFATYPEQATLPLLMEYVATALNPRQGLIGGRRLADLMRRTPDLAAALGIFGAALDTAEWAVYEVQRARLPHGTTRRITIHATGTRNAARATLGEIAARLGAHVDEPDGHPRAWLRRPAPNPPTIEWFYVTAPATAVAKTGPGFAGAWATALEADPPTLFDLDYGRDAALWKTSPMTCASIRPMSIGARKLLPTGCGGR